MLFFSVSFLYRWLTELNLIIKKMFYFSCNFCLSGSKSSEASSTRQYDYDFLRKIFIPKNHFLNNKLNKVIIALFLVFGFSISQTLGQRDQITTQSGEKIRCRILDETPNRFKYAYLSESGKVLRNEIFKNLVSDFKYNFYSNDIVTKGNKLPDGLGGTKEENAKAKSRIDTRKSQPTQAKTEQLKSDRRNELVETKKKLIPNESSSKKELSKVEKAIETTKQEENSTASINEKKATSKKEAMVLTPMATPKADNEFSNFLKWRLGVKGGLGNRLAKIPNTNAYGLFQEKLLRGYTWGGDVAFFPGDYLGIGLMFNDFQANNKADNIVFINEILNKPEMGSISNKRSIKYAGPIFYYRKHIDFKTMVVLGLSQGAYFYKETGSYNTANYTFKGIDFGASATLGIDFLIGNDITGRDIILSLEAGYSYGKMRAVDFGAGDGAINLSTPMDLSRLDFTVGLRFTRYPKYFR
jgi:hypothetical protein